MKSTNVIYVKEEKNKSGKKPIILPTSVRDLLIYTYLLVKGGTNELGQDELFNLRESHIKEIQLVNKIKYMLEDKLQLQASGNINKDNYLHGMTSPYAHNRNQKSKVEKINNLTTKINNFEQQLLKEDKIRRINGDQEGDVVFNELDNHLKNVTCQVKNFKLLNQNIIDSVSPKSSFYFTPSTSSMHQVHQPPNNFINLEDPIDIDTSPVIISRGS